MESATVRRAPSLPEVTRLGLIAVLFGLAIVAWALTDERMAGMDAGPGTDTGALGWFLGVWVVMMAAMMFPSIAPMVVMYARIQAGRQERGDAAAATGATVLFVAGYLVTWTSAGLLGYTAYEAVQSLEIGWLAWDEAGQYVAGGVIVGAAIYQLTPLKDACLRKCRSPFAFLLTAWRPGRAGALRMGIEHGAWCVGCCWALMAALFALGVMSIGWMAFIAAVIATEKLLPWKALANRGIAVLLLALGLAVALVPEDVPGLTVPGSAEASQAMEAMGMEPGAIGESGMREHAAGAGMDEGMSDEGMSP